MSGANTLNDHLISNLETYDKDIDGQLFQLQGDQALNQQHEKQNQNTKNDLFLQENQQRQGSKGTKRNIKKIPKFSQDLLCDPDTGLQELYRMFSRVDKGKDDLGVLTQIYDTYIKWHMQFMPRIERNFLYHKIQQVSDKSTVQFHLQELRRFHKEGRQISSRNHDNIAQENNNVGEVIQNEFIGINQQKKDASIQDQSKFDGNIFDQLDQYNIAELYGNTQNKNYAQAENQTNMQIDQYPDDLFED